MTGSGTFESYVSIGSSAGATPDGRLSGQPIASDCSPQPFPQVKRKSWPCHVYILHVSIYVYVHALNLSQLILFSGQTCSAHPTWEAIGYHWHTETLQQIEQVCTLYWQCTSWTFCCCCVVIYIHPYQDLQIYPVCMQCITSLVQSFLTTWSCCEFRQPTCWTCVV